MSSTPHPHLKYYSYQVHWSDEDDAYVAKVAEFPLLSADGPTASEAIDEMKNVVAMAIELMEEDGDPIPEPLSQKSYSGKFVVRIPPMLHAELAKGAAEQGVSLNRYVALKLAL